MKIVRQLLQPSDVAADLAFPIVYTTVRPMYWMAPQTFAERKASGRWALAGWDFGIYIIRYGEGGYRPVHVDPPPYPAEHHRLVVMLRSAEEGGQLCIDGDVVDLEPGDGVFYRPDIQPHLVMPTSKGERIVLSMGKLVKAP